MTQNNKPIKEVFNNIIARKDGDPYAFFCVALQYKDMDAASSFAKKIDILQHPDTLQKFIAACDDFTKIPSTLTDIIDRGDYKHDDLLKVFTRVCERHKEPTILADQAILLYKRGFNPFRAIEEGSNDLTKTDFYKAIETTTLNWLLLAHKNNELTLDERKAVELTMRETCQKKMATILTEKVMQSPLVDKEDVVDPKHLPAMIKLKFKP